MPEYNDELKLLLGEIKSTWQSYRQYMDNQKPQLGRVLKMRGELEEKMAGLEERIGALEVGERRPMRGGAVDADGFAINPLAPHKSNGGIVRTKHPEYTEETKAFISYIRGGKAEMSADERKALVEDGSGAILVPEELDNVIYQTLPKLTVMRRIASALGTSRDRVRRRSLGKPSVSWGKLETGAQTLTDSMPGVPTEAYLYVEDLYGLARIGEDELSDVEVDLAQLISANFAEAIASAEDTAFFAGTGHANNQPEGVLNGTVVARVNAAQAGAVTVDDMIALLYAVPAQARANGSFVWSSDTERRVRQLKDANDNYLWQPSVQAGRPATFLGYPAYASEDIPNVPAAGTAADVAVFGDFRMAYQIRDRQTASVQRLNELYAETGEVGFRVRHRVAGGVVRPEALRVLHVPAA